VFVANDLKTVQLPRILALNGPHDEGRQGKSGARREAVAIRLDAPRREILQCALSSTGPRQARCAAGRCQTGDRSMDPRAKQEHRERERRGRVE